MKRKKGEPPDIKTLSKRTQVIRNWCGAYDMLDGSIHIGCDEKHAPSIIWHETIHMLLFEQFCLEATRMWDNIADNLQCYLFDICPQDLPEVWKSPPFKAPPVDENWINGKKASEKSEIVGWTQDPKYQRKVPIHKIEDREC